MFFIELLASIGLEVPPDTPLYGGFVVGQTFMVALLIALVLALVFRQIHGLYSPVARGSRRLARIDRRIAGVFWRCLVLGFLLAVAGDAITPEVLPQFSEGALVATSNVVNVVLIMAFFRRLSKLVDVCVGPRGLLAVDARTERAIEGFANATLFAFGAVLVFRALGADLTGVFAAAGFAGTLVTLASLETAASFAAYLTILVLGTYSVGQDIQVFPRDTFAEASAIRGRVVAITPLQTILDVGASELVLSNREMLRCGIRRALPNGEAEGGQNGTR